MARARRRDEDWIVQHAGESECGGGALGHSRDRAGARRGWSACGATGHSGAAGGTPGADEHLVFSRWLASRGETDPLAPSGIDAWDNLSAFAFARDLGVSNLWGEISVAPGDDFAVFTYTRRRGVVDLVFTEEVSPTLIPPAWTTTSLAPVSTQDHGDGTETLTFQLQAPLGAGPRAYVRVRVDAP